jgi:hypothetical protein
MMNVLGMLIFAVGSVLFFLVGPALFVRCFWQILHLRRACAILRLDHGFVALGLYGLAVWWWWEHWQIPATMAAGAG